MIGVTETLEGSGAGLHPWGWLGRVSVLKICRISHIPEMGWERDDHVNAAVC